MLRRCGFLFLYILLCSSLFFQCEKLLLEKRKTQEPFENYKEENIPSVYTKFNENEHYCNVVLNKNNEIEYYTYSRESGACNLWKYTLIKNPEEGSDSENAVSENCTCENGASENIICGDAVSKSAVSGNCACENNASENIICGDAVSKGAVLNECICFYYSAFWKREPVSWLAELAEEINGEYIYIFVGEDQEDYAWYIGKDKNAHLVKRIKDSSDKDSFIEIKGLNWRDPEFTQVAVLENGNIVIADLGKKCFIYDQNNGSLLTSFDIGWYESLCVDKNQVYTTDRTGSFIQHYNAANQEFEEMIASEFGNSVQIACQENELYLCCWKGIYRAKQSQEGLKDWPNILSSSKEDCSIIENKKEFQKILDAEKFYFAEETRNLLKFFVVNDVFYIVYKEGKVDIKKYTPKDLECSTTNFQRMYCIIKPWKFETSKMDGFENF